MRAGQEYWLFKARNPQGIEEVEKYLWVESKVDKLVEESEELEKLIMNLVSMREKQSMYDRIVSLFLVMMKGILAQVLP